LQQKQVINNVSEVTMPAFLVTLIDGADMFSSVDNGTEKNWIDAVM
jgi:hypothetical protein